MTNRKIEISVITMTSAYALARFSMLGNRVPDLCVQAKSNNENGNIKWLHFLCITPIVLNNEDNYKSIK